MHSDAQKRCVFRPTSFSVATTTIKVMPMLMVDTAAASGVKLERR